VDIPRRLTFAPNPEPPWIFRKPSLTRLVHALTAGASGIVRRACDVIEVEQATLCLLITCGPRLASMGPTPKKKEFSFWATDKEASCPFCVGGVPRSGAKITDRPDGSGLDWFGSPASCHGWQPPLRRKRGPRACRPFRGTFGTIRGRIPGNNQKDQCPRDDQKRPVCSINLVTTVQARS